MIKFRAKAPLRVSFAGGGTDVPPYQDLYGGCVLNATIDNFAWGSLRHRHDRRIRIESADLDLEVELHGDEEVPMDDKLDLAKAAIKRLGALNSDGFDIFLHTDAPPGSGLGSSSALIVALVGLVREYKGLPIETYELAKTAYSIEREDLKISGGLQDQYAAAFGGFNFIEFGRDRVIVNPLRIRRWTVNELEHNLLLSYTGSTRRSDRISNPAIDELYEGARKKGAIGGKNTGAGGGAYIMFYCEFEKKHKVAKQLCKMGAIPTEFAFEEEGLQTWRTDDKIAG